MDFSLPPGAFQGEAATSGMMDQDLEPTAVFPADSATAAPQRRQDNTVLNAAAALLSIPSQIAASSPPLYSTPAPAGMFAPPFPKSNSHHDPSHTTTALMDLVSPASMLPMAAAATSPARQTEPQDPDTAYYYEGTCSLSLPEDDDFLSPLHSFIRRYCVETFTASAQDASESQFGRSHGSRVVPGQVGIRCCFCANKHVASSHGTADAPQSPRRERAVCFPSSLKNIYHSIETWQRRHSLVCEDIPTWVKASMADLCKTSKSGAGGRRQYWEDSARRIGLANTSHGIRFIRPPGDLGPPLLVTEEAAAAVAQAASQGGMTASSALLAAVGPPPLLKLEPVSPGIPVVRDDDKSLVKDYLYVLLDQMEMCYFSEEDRAGGRSKVKDCPIGYPGMQCRHCKGKAGFGRYFPGTLAALTSANSDRNIFNHIVKCRRCPQHVKDELTLLQQQHQTLKNRRGSRKLFFEKIWARLHGDEASDPYAHRQPVYQHPQSPSQQRQQGIQPQSLLMPLQMMSVQAHAM